MFKTFAPTAALVLAVTLSGGAAAHFQSIYTPDPVFAAPATVPVDLIYWHPQTTGAVFDMPRPLEFYVTHKGKKSDLLPSLKPINFTAANTGKGFRGEVPLADEGDYVLTLVAAPYLDKPPGSEDFYIQQFVKVYLNRSGATTDWNRPQDLPAEILPMVRPYNVLVGSTFTGQVLSDGYPGGRSEISIEYMAMVPDMATNTAAKPTVGKSRGGDILITTDDEGVFTFGIPKAGWWGFVAVGVGPQNRHMGKHMYQDAVIWVYAHDLK